MIGTFIVPAKKYLDIPGKVLTIVLVLTISIFQSTAAANALILDDEEAGTSSTGRHWHWGKTEPHGSSSLHTSKSNKTYYSRTDWFKHHTGESKHRTRASKHRTGGRKHHTSVSHDITHLDGTSTVTVNQPDATSLVDKTATTTTRSLDNSATSADAIMLVPAVDNTTVNTAPEMETIGSQSVTVNSTETHTGAVTLNWTAPVARTDGSPITMSEIAGFTVHYGTATGSHPNRLNVDDGSATSATISSLQVGTYYLVVTTRDDAGRESGDSGEVAKVVN